MPLSMTRAASHGCLLTLRCKRYQKIVSSKRIFSSFSAPSFTAIRFMIGVQIRHNIILATARKSNFQWLIHNPVRGRALNLNLGLHN